MRKLIPSLTLVLGAILMLTATPSTYSADEDERVARELKVYDQCWQDRELSGLLRRLEKLEAKYLKKVRAG